jgi:RNA polymerase sigma-70 factor (ECF subfamily)
VTLPNCEPDSHALSLSQILTGPEWAARVRAGDIDAFEAAFRALCPGLCVYLLRYLHSREAAEDLIQEVFLSIWKNRGTLDVRESVTTYLYTVARNRALDVLKHERVVARWRQHVTPITDAVPSVAEDEVADAEMTEALRRAIEALPPRCREIYLLNRQQGLTYADIATSLGISVKTVETQMGRALKAIRARLQHLLP